MLGRFDEARTMLAETRAELAERGGGIRLAVTTGIESVNFELLAGDPTVAAEEGLAYIPPTDPPVARTDGEDELEIAAGFGTSSLDEPYDEDHAGSLLSTDDEMSARVREALRADAATTQYADDIDIETAGGVVLLRGVVEDIDDTDALAEVLYGSRRPTSDRAVDVIVTRLRKKIVTLGGPPAQGLIKTEFRRGYVFVAEVSLGARPAPARVAPALEARTA